MVSIPVTYKQRRVAKQRYRYLRVDLIGPEDSTVLVRIAGLVLPLSALVITGCAGHRGSAGSFSELPCGRHSSVSLPAAQVIVTADNRLTGKVARVNGEGRFVVMTFPIGHLPSLQQRLGVFRLGLKVGDIRVTGPQLDDSVVGDILAGDAQPGDEVRAQ